MSRARARWCAAAAVGFGCVLATIAIFRTELSDGEVSGYAYGRCIVFDGRCDAPAGGDSSLSPVLALAALPERVATGLGSAHALPTALMTGLIPDYVREHSGAYAGRLIMLLFYLATCALVFAWGREVYGDRGALGATVLVAFLPPTLAQAATVSIDAAAACMLLAAVYAISRCLLDPTLQWAAIAGVVCGGALLSTPAAIALVVVAPCFVLIRALTAERHESKRRVVQGAATSLLLIAIVALALRAGLGSALPTPTDGAWHLGHAASVDSLGTQRVPGTATDYALAIALETPIPFLVLLLARPWRAHRRYTDLIWLAAVVGLGVETCVSRRLFLGARDLLPIFPFLALLAGAAWDHARAPVWRRVASAAALLIALESAWNCPRYRSYVNQLRWGEPQVGQVRRFEHVVQVD
jgi:4-amino-4-deoxy-L-arabinose transferase-like glycosyltransferase